MIFHTYKYLVLNTTGTYMSISATSSKIDLFERKQHMFHTYGKWRVLKLAAATISSISYRLARFECQIFRYGVLRPIDIWG